MKRRKYTKVEISVRGRRRPYKSGWNSRCFKKYQTPRKGYDAAIAARRMRETGRWRGWWSGRRRASRRDGVRDDWDRDQGGVAVAF